MSKVITSVDMYDYVLAGMNKELNGSMTPAEFEELINGSQMKTITTIAEMVETQQRPIDDLRSLVREVEMIPTNVAFNQFDFENPAIQLLGVPLVIADPVSIGLPAGQNGYLRNLACKVKWNYINNPCYPNGVPTDDKPYAWTVMKPMKSDYIFSNPRDFYNRATDDRPYWQLKAVAGAQTVMEVINNTASRAHRVFMQYLVHPRTITLANNLPTDLDLPIHLRQTVCETAIRIILERIESARRQSVIQEQQLNIQ